jgi:hypothetical protein
MFRKLDLFLSSGERRETPTLLGLLERANLNHWITHVKSKSKLYYDRQSVGQSFMVSDTHLRPATNFPPALLDYFWTVAGLLMWGALSDEKSDL